MELLTKSLERNNNQESCLEFPGSSFYLLIMEKNNIINILSDPEVSMDQKFHEYCKFYQEYITTPFNDYLEPIISDAVQEFYPEFHIF